MLKSGSALRVEKKQAWLLVHIMGSKRYSIHQGKAAGRMGRMLAGPQRQASFLCYLITLQVRFIPSSHHLLGHGVWWIVSLPLLIYLSLLSQLDFCICLVSTPSYPIILLRMESEKLSVLPTILASCVESSTVICYVPQHQIQEATDSASDIQLSKCEQEGSGRWHWWMTAAAQYYSNDSARTL